MFLKNCQTTKKMYVSAKKNHLKLTHFLVTIYQVFFKELILYLNINLTF